MRFDRRFHDSFISRLKYNVRFSIKRTGFVFMHEAVEVSCHNGSRRLVSFLCPSVDLNEIVSVLRLVFLRTHDVTGCCELLTLKATVASQRYHTMLVTCM